MSSMKNSRFNLAGTVKNSLPQLSFEARMKSLVAGEILYFYIYIYIYIDGRIGREVTHGKSSSFDQHSKIVPLTLGGEGERAVSKGGHSIHRFVISQGEKVVGAHLHPVTPKGTISGGMFKNRIKRMPPPGFGSGDEGRLNRLIIQPYSHSTGGSGIGLSNSGVNNSLVVNNSNSLMYNNNNRQSVVNKRNIKKKNVIGNKEMVVKGRAESEIGYIKKDVPSHHHMGTFSAPKSPLSTEYKGIRKENKSPFTHNEVDSMHMNNLGNLGNLGNVGVDTVDTVDTVDNIDSRENIENIRNIENIKNIQDRYDDPSPTNNKGDI